jgi:hypothetical protein
MGRLFAMLPALAVSATFVPLWFGLILLDVMLVAVLVFTKGQPARLFAPSVVVDDGVERPRPVDQKWLVVACLVFLVLTLAMGLIVGVGD